MDRMACDAALRIATSPVYAQIIMERSTRRSGRLVSPLETLTKRIERKTASKIENLEMIVPYSAPPWWIPPKLIIEGSKEKAEAAHKELIVTTKAKLIYTDGSGINGKIGAAAVGGGITGRAYLGPSTSYTVYSAELYGIILALFMGFRTGYKDNHIIICADNQTALKAIANPRGGSGQHMVKFIVWLIDDHRRRGVNVELHWVPAHIGIAGNEAADVAAKQATGWKSKRRSRGPLVEIDTDDKAKQTTMIKELKSARKQAIRKDILPQWTALWKEETRGRDLFRIEPSPRKAILRLHDDLSKEMSTIAVQLRTRKIGLNHFLFGRGVLGFDSPVCSCRQGKQTVEHVLFHCMRHQRQRRGLWLAEKREAKWGEVTLRQVLTDPRSLLKAVHFIKESGLIGQFRAPIMEEDDY